MALILCPECAKQVSSAATVCPHCGFPILRPSPTPPAVSQQIQLTDVTDTFPIIPIDAKDSQQAANLIAQHLAKMRGAGWTTGDAWALLDGWRNEYEIKNATTKARLRFDMRPTLRRGVVALSLTMLTMMASAPHGPDMFNELERQDRVAAGKGCLPCVIPVSIAVGAAFVRLACS